MRTRTLGLLTVGAVVLSGCTGGGEDPQTSSTSIATPTNTSSSTSSASPSSSDGTASSTAQSAEWTTPPEAATVDSREGAQEFAKWYTQVSGQAQHVMDGDLIRDQSTKGCVKCEDLAALADGRRGVQHPSINPYTQITKVKTLKWGDEPTFQVDFSIPKHDLLNDEGKKEATVRAEKAGFAMRLQRADDRWRASEFTLAYRDGMK